MSFFTNKTINVQQQRRIINLCCYISSNNDFYIKSTTKLVEKVNIATQVK